MTSASMGFAGFVDWAGATIGPSPPETLPSPGTEPVPFSEPRRKGLAVAERAAEAKWFVRGGGFFWDEGGSPRLAGGPRVGALSDEADPQPASPARSIRLMSSARNGKTGSWDGRDRRMPLAFQGMHSMKMSPVNIQNTPTLTIANLCVFYYAVPFVYPLPSTIQSPQMRPPRMRGCSKAWDEG